MESLKAKVRDFEDRKISMADLSREVFHAAREIQADGSAELRRSLERIGNRLMSLSEGGLSGEGRRKAIELVDELNDYLIDAGY